MESRTHLNTVKITLNIFAVCCQIWYQSKSDYMDRALVSDHLVTSVQCLNSATALALYYCLLFFRKDTPWVCNVASTKARENLEVFLFISSRASPWVSRDQDELSYSLSHSYQVYHIWELENWDESKAGGRSYAWLLGCMQYYVTPFIEFSSWKLNTD